MTLAVTNTFVANTLAEASKVNKNFADLVAAVGTQVYTGLGANWYTDDESSTVSLQAIADALADFDPTNKYWNKLVINQTSAFKTSAAALAASCGYLQVSAGTLYFISRTGSTALGAASIPTGYIQGFGYKHKGNKAVTINGGQVEIGGSIYSLSVNTLNVTLSARLGYQLSARKYYGLYWDAPASGTTLGALDVELAPWGGSTIPTWDGATASWRHPTTTDWRLFGLIRTSATSTVLSCSRNGGRFTFTPMLNILNTATPVGYTMTALAAGVPVSCRFVINFQAYTYDAGTAHYILMTDGDDTGAAAVSGNQLLFSYTPAGDYAGGMGVRKSSLAGKVRYATPDASQDTKIWVHSFELPEGL